MMMMIRRPTNVISLLAAAAAIRGATAFTVTPATSTTTTPSRLPTATTSSSTALSAKSGLMFCKPIGIGSATPQSVMTNKDLENVVETSDEWIRTRTGIGKRHVLTQDEKLADLCVTAAQNALDMAGVDATDIDIVVNCCSSSDDLFGDATTIAAQIGCTTETVAFDLTAACSGFLFGLVTAGQFLNAPGKKQRALVIGADALSRYVDWDDRNVCILFGDGAGAMVLESTGQQKEDQAGVLGYAAHSNGKGNVELNCMYESAPRLVKTPGEGTNVGHGKYGDTFMNGKEVYKFATREVPRVLEEVLDASGLTVDDVDWLLLHQANIRIMDTVAKRLGMPMDKVIANLEEYGNTSAASIPLALDEAVRAGKVKKGDVIACSGFGAGLSWGAVVLKWG